MKIKICYILSNVQKALAFEWISVKLKDKYDLFFILLNPVDSPLEQFLLKNDVSVSRVSYSGKKDFLRAWLKTYRILRKEKPDVVHSHLLDAQLIGLSAAWMAGIPKRIYTRHNSNFHHAYWPHGVKYDKWSNRLATDIVSISQATDYTLKHLEYVPEKKISKIYHGFDFEALTNVADDRVLTVRQKWNIRSDRFVIGVISRHIEWKGIQYIIPAFKKILKKYPGALLVLANASGPYHDVIANELKELNDSVIEIPFEEDVAALYRTFSIYVHTPVDSLVEAFGQTYVEALAIGIPSVFTKSGIAAEFIKDEENALVVDFKSSDSIHNAITRLIEDDDLRDRLVKKGKEDVFLQFDLSKMITGLESLYNGRHPV